MRVLSIFKATYYIGSLIGSLGWAFVYYRWRLWRATKVFERQLRAEGLPAALVSDLTRSYVSQFKQLPGRMMAGFRPWKRRE